jgi:hypothetical protein
VPLKAVEYSSILLPFQGRAKVIRRHAAISADYFYFSSSFLPAFKLSKFRIVLNTSE